jgi:hypothetical protein
MPVDEIARWAGILAASALGVIVVAFGTSPQTSRRTPSLGRPLTNAGVETQASAKSVVTSAIDATKSNPWLIPTLLIAIFAIITLVRPTDLLPVKDDIAIASAPSLSLTLAVDSNRHLEEGDSFELRLTLDGTKSHVGQCEVSEPSALTARAVAPGADVAAVTSLTFDPRLCRGFALWVVAIKKPGDLVVATTLFRKAKKDTKDIASVVAHANIEQSRVTNDALFSALVTAIVALFAIVRRGAADAGS